MMMTTREKIFVALVAGAGSEEDAEMMAHSAGLTLTQMVDAIYQYRENLDFSASLAADLAALEKNL